MNAHRLALYALPMLACGSAPPSATPVGRIHGPALLDLVPAGAVAVVRLDLLSLGAGRAPAAGPLGGFEQTEEETFLWRSSDEQVIAVFDGEDAPSPGLTLYRGRFDGAALQKARSFARRAAGDEPLFVGDVVRGRVLGRGDARRVRAASAVYRQRGPRASDDPELGWALGRVPEGGVAVGAVRFTESLREELAEDLEPEQPGIRRALESIRAASASVRLTRGLVGRGVIRAGSEGGAALVARATGNTLRILARHPIAEVLAIGDVLTAIRVETDGEIVNLAVEVTPARLSRFSRLLRGLTEVTRQLAHDAGRGSSRRASGGSE